MVDFNTISVIYRIFMVRIESFEKQLVIETKMLYII